MKVPAKTLTLVITSMVVQKGLSSPIPMSPAGELPVIHLLAPLISAERSPTFADLELSARSPVTVGFADAIEARDLIDVRNNKQGPNEMHETMEMKGEMPDTSCGLAADDAGMVLPLPPRDIDARDMLDTRGNIDGSNNAGNSGGGSGGGSHFGESDWDETHETDRSPYHSSAPRGV